MISINTDEELLVLDDISEEEILRFTADVDGSLQIETLNTGHVYIPEHETALIKQWLDEL